MNVERYERSSPFKLYVQLSLNMAFRNFVGSFQLPIYEYFNTYLQFYGCNKERNKLSEDLVIDLIQDKEYSYVVAHLPMQ